MADPAPIHVIKQGIVYELREVPDGGYFVSVPALPGCTSFGETMDDALREVRDAIVLWIEVALERGMDVPDEFVPMRQAS